MDRWLPVGYEIDETQLGRLTESDEKWQVYRSSDDGTKVLVCQAELVDRWIEHQLLRANCVHQFSFCEEHFGAVKCGVDQQLCAVASPPSDDLVESDLEGFADSILASRKLLGSDNLGDAIYLERFSILLPTWSLDSPLSDDEILGLWISGGVRVSSGSTRRIAALAPWVSTAQIAELRRRAGLVEGDVPSQDQVDTDTSTNAGRTRSKSDRQEGSDATVSPDSFSLPGRPQLEQFFREHVIDIVEQPDKYAAFGVTFPSAAVLHGPPGCGKTYAVEKLTEYLDWPIYRIEAGSVGSPYIHETSRKVAEVFEEAAANSPAAVIIDEMEAFLSDRQAGGSTAMHRVEEVGEFLRRIPEALERKVLIVGMTNRPEMIDPAILRRGRFDHVIEVGMPTQEEILLLLRSLLASLPSAEDLSLDEAAQALDGRAPSDVAFVVKNAGRIAARVGDKAIAMTHIAEAIKLLPPATEKKQSRPIGFVWDR